MFIRSKFGKVTLFSSGKMVLLGCKSVMEIEELYKDIAERCARI